MAKVLINQNDLEKIINSYKDENNTFVFGSFSGTDRKKTCVCFINGKDCKIDFFVKKQSTNILPVGKNIDESNLLIKYIASKGYSADVPVNQVVFLCKKQTINSLIEFIKEEFSDTISIIHQGNIYRFQGYNGDIVTFTFYPSTEKVMIQGKPYQTFGIIITFLATLMEVSFEQIVGIGNAIVGTKISCESIRDEIKSKLGNAYSYMDEALLKSISGSLSMLKHTRKCEDYTGCLTGIFKALEGFLKKTLTQNYSYKINKNNSFSMFYRQNGIPSEIDNDTNILAEAKKELISLYELYKSKRNIYLHATVDPSLTSIIENLKNAQDIADEILSAIKKSYSVIFQ